MQTEKAYSECPAVFYSSENTTEVYMFINLVDEKWVETDNIITFEPYIDTENVSFENSHYVTTFTGGSLSEYSMGFIINGFKLELFTNKNKQYDSDGQKAINLFGDMIIEDKQRLENIYYEILEIKTGCSYKNLKTQWVIHKGKRGERRKFKCLETGEIFNTKTKAIEFLRQKGLLFGSYDVIDKKLTDVLNNKSASCCGFHFNLYKD